jgi:hypothetical protein
MTIKPFHQWKEDQRKKDAPLVRPTEWYYGAYGRYCNKQRRDRATQN